MDFNSSIEDISSVAKQASVSIPASVVDENYNVELRRLAGRVQIKGFRPGKAPHGMVEKLHGDRVRLDVANKLISQALRELLTDIKDVIGTPEIELSSFDAGKPLEFTAKIWIYPEPKLDGYETFQVELPEQSVSDEDLDRVVEQLRRSRATQRAVEGRDTAASGDVITAQVQVRVDGIDPQPPEPVVVGLGEGQLPAELEQGIIGMRVGQEQEILTTLAPDHRRAELRGKEVCYLVKLEALAELVLPELTDEFVGSLDLPDVKTVLELKVDVRKQLEAEMERQASSAVRDQVLGQLAEQHQFEIPEPLIVDEVRHLVIREGLVQNEQPGQQFSIEPWRERFWERAERRVRLSIIIDRIAEQENIRAEQEDVDAYMGDVASGSNLALEHVQSYFMGGERRTQTFLEVGRNKVIKFLEQRAEVRRVAASEPEKLAEK